MGKNIEINEKIEKYISDHSCDLNSIQKEIIIHNESLGDVKRMQIAISQCYFLQLIIKTAKIKNILEIGTFTGLSTLSMALALPKDGKLVTLDKNKETSKKAELYFKKANLDNKIEIILNNALESMKNLLNEKNKFNLIIIDAD